MGSKRDKKQIPPTKIVIRKLPTTFTEEEFKNAISPLPEHNYFSFVTADRGLGPHAFSRAYINFLNPEDILSFRDRFDGYVFVDQKGNEFPALVEYAPFQKIPKTNNNKKDIRCGTIDEDPDYVAFLNALQNPEIVNLPPIETLLEEIENIERETRANNGVLKVKTPLLEYVEQRMAERLRPGDRKRRKEFDRKKAREEEKRRRKEMIKEYRKRDDYYRDDRDKDRSRKRDEGKMKWIERKKEEREALKREKVERYKGDDKYRSKDWASADRKQNLEHGEDVGSSKASPVGGKEEKKFSNPRTKRYSEVRKKEEEKKKYKEEKEVCGDRKAESDKTTTTTLPDVVPVPPPTGETEERYETKVESVMKEEVNEEEDQQLEEPKKMAKEETEEKQEEIEDAQKDDNDEKMSKDPRTERRIRNKDRPSMQLYRPGQARLKTRLKSEDGGGERGNDGDSSSSSSASPVMGVSEEKKEKEKSSDPETKSSSKGFSSKGTFEKKSNKFRESRGSSYYWDERERGNGNYKEDFEGRGRGGSRRGYSYHHERENKGKWSSSSGSRARDTESAQFKSMTFRRSTSQE